MIETSRRGVPMMLINGRLSENSFRRWRYLPVTIGDLLRRLDLCLARTPADAQRFGDLGAPRVVTTGDLKLDGPAPPADRVKLAALQSAVAGRPIIAAASTHAGEETAMIDAHRRLRTNFLSLLTLIAPRHPERGVGVGDIARAAGLRVRLRSRGELPDATTDVYVADTFGELGLIYRLAPIVFVGGSLVKHGGQNPIEPAKLGAAILHGPHVWNFAEIYAALDQAHGAEPVADASKLTASFGTLLTQAEARSRIADAARTTVEALGGGLERTLKSLDPYLMQLRLRQRADNA
jgi:3-deoxy-D-manno-octulosonic-acid transferase